MAMKIKKRRRKDDDAEVGGESAELSEDSLEEGDEEGELLEDELDLSGSPAAWDTAAWIERNRKIVIGVVGVALVGSLGVYFLLDYQKKAEEASSETLAEAIESYSVFVESSPEFKEAKANPRFKAPEKTFKTDEEKWQAIYKEAGESIESEAGKPIVQGSRLAKAAAALRLGKYDESIKLYEAYFAGKDIEGMDAIALYGAAQAYAGAGKVDEAIKKLDEMAKADDDLASVAVYRKGRILESAGKVEEAKKVYHKILEDEPATPYKVDLERRLAVL